MEILNAKPKVASRTTMPIDPSVALPLVPFKVLPTKQRAIHVIKMQVRMIITMLLL